MAVAKRTFVMAMADAYRLGRELIDQEPNRSVQIRRRVDTRIPNPLLSAIALPPAVKPALGSLGNLRAPAPAPTSKATLVWGTSKATTTGSTTSGSGTAAGTNHTGTSAAIVASTIPSRSATPVAPVIDQSVPLSFVRGRVGDAEGDDWDVDA